MKPAADNKTDCTVMHDWAILPVTTLDVGAKPTSGPTSMSIRQARAHMESNGIAVNLEIETPPLAGTPVVYVNGKETKVLRISPNPGTDKTQHTVQVQVPQTVDRRDAHGRTLRVDIDGKTKDGKDVTASIEVTARWP